MINYMLFELNWVTSNNNYTSKIFLSKKKVMIKLIKNIVKYKLCLLH